MKNDRQAYIAQVAKLPDKLYGPRIPRRRQGVSVVLPTLLLLTILYWIAS